MVEGSPLDLGRRHGSLARKEIETNLEIYFYRFREEWALQREEVLRRAGIYAEVIEELDGGYYEAMQGVSEGSSLPFLDIVALNVRYELVYSEYSKLGKDWGLPSGCTAVGLLPDRTDSGHLLMAQNWDWIPGIEGVIQQYKPLEGPETLAFTEAGIVGGKIGLNSRGLGLMINGLLSDQDNWETLGVPFHVRCWRVLQKESLGDAAAFLTNSLGSCSANFMLGQANGQAAIVDLETCPSGAEEILPERGVVTHANHFLKPDSLGIWEPLIEEKTTTYQRHERIEALLDARKALFSTLDLQRFLEDHKGRPGSICRHQEEALPDPQRYQTVVSVIMDLDERQLAIATGNPCENDYRTFRLSSEE